MSFVACELHCHTVHSDGDFKVSELELSAKENGLSAIALTDHNTYSGYDEVNNEIIPVIKGIEWTTYFGHMLVLGANNFVDWRDAAIENIDEKIRQVKKTGALVGIAHLFQLGSPMCTGGRWEFNVENWNNVDYIEIWHERFCGENQENEKATSFWTKKLDEGYKLACTYGRDWHRTEKKHQYGCTYVDVDGNITPATVINSIKNGRTVASTGAEFYFNVKQNGKTFSLGDTIEAEKSTFVFSLNTEIRNRYHCDNEFVYEKILIRTNGDNVTAEIRPDEKEISLILDSGCWYRAELWGTISGRKEPLAITSPIYTY